MFNTKCNRYKKMDYMIIKYINKKINFLKKLPKIESFRILKKSAIFIKLVVQ